MKEKPETPKVGVGVIILFNNDVLLGKRKGSHGPGEYSLPGGHLDMFESFEDCCMRETLEETDLHIFNIEKVTFFPNIFEEEKLHYVTLFFKSIVENPEDLKTMEPDKCEGWGWFDLGHLPSPIFGRTKEVCQQLYKEIQTDYRASDYERGFHDGEQGNCNP